MYVCMYVYIYMYYTYLHIHTTIYIWRFPEMGVPPNHHPGHAQMATGSGSDEGGAGKEGCAGCAWWPPKSFTQPTTPIAK